MHTKLEGEAFCVQMNIQESRRRINESRESIARADAILERDGRLGLTAFPEQGTNPRTSALWMITDSGP